MKSKTKNGFIIAAALMLLLSSGCVKDNCGDGICQPLEERNGSCPEDCYQTPSKTIENITIRTITGNGGNVDWHHKSNKIAIGKLGDDGYFDVWLINPDGSNEKCLTCNHEDLPNKHVGNAAWYPSGECLVIQVEKSTVPKYYDNKATPGAGMLNDLYIITKDGKQVWELYRVNDAISDDSPGILHPHFSHDGEKLAWAERIKDNDRPFGEWAIKIADFEFIGNSPRLSNIETFQPGSRSSFYETHTFSPDDSKLLFTGNQDGSLEIYELDIETKKVKRLTNNPTGWDEHATYSPDGTKIIWMSSKDVQFSSSPFYLQTEFWLMDADGNNKKRLTYFHEKGHPHYFKTTENGIAVAADNSWGPDGNHLIALVITADPESDERDQGRIVMIEFDSSKVNSLIPDDLVEMDYLLKDIEVIKENGGRLDWSQKTDRIAFDKEGNDGYFDLFTMNPDGSGEKCLTCDKAGLPGKHMGQPSWHSSGEYIVFQAQEADYSGDTILASPGWGIGNNLWIITADGEEYWKLTTLPSGSGVLHPHFSPDGKKIVWSEIAAGENDASIQDIGDEFADIWNLAEFWATRDWGINIGDFYILDGVPQLSNITLYKPGVEVIGLRETHGFSPDDEKIIFSSIHDHGNWWAPDIFSMELSTGFVQKLTSTADHWDEHAQYSPDGRKIIWITSEGFKDFSGDGRNELWIMNADGSEKQRVTYFNQPGELGYTGYGIACGDSSWSPDGEWLALYRILMGKTNQNSATYPNRTTEIVLIEFD